MLAVPVAPAGGSEWLPFAEYVGRRIAELSLTLEAVAARVTKVSGWQAHPTPQAVHHWRRGHVTPHPETVRWLALALDADLSMMAMLADAQRKGGDDVERRQF